MGKKGVAEAVYIACIWLNSFFKGLEIWEKYVNSRALGLAF